MLKRFEQVQQRVGRDLLRRFQDATSTVTWRRGAYLRIYYQLLENWKVTIDQIYQELPAVVPITFAEASKNQHMALKRVDKNLVAVSSAPTLRAKQVSLPAWR